MSRSVDEWRGKTDDSDIPARVKFRVFTRFNGRCANCTLIVVGKLRPAYDHCIAIINGGPNRETNLQLLCVPCHAVKTRADVSEKSKVYKRAASNAGIRKPSRLQSAGFRRTGPQRTASRPIVRHSEC